MAYYDPNKEYDSGGIWSFLQAGAKQNGAYAAQQADLQDLVGGLSIEMQRKAGLISDEEASEKTVAFQEETRINYERNMKAVNDLANSNAFWNTVGIVTSVASLGTMAGGNMIATKLGTKAGELAAASKAATGVAKIAPKVGSWALDAGSAALKGISFKGASFKGVAARLAISAAPTVASQLYTRSCTDKQAVEFQETIHSLQSSYDYLSSEDDSLTDQIKSDTESWRSSYEAGSQALIEKFQAGEMTQEEYDAAYEQFINDSNEEWKKVQEQHGETAKYVTEHGVAYATDEYIADHGYDPDMVNAKCDYIAKLNKDNPDAYEAAKTAYDTRQQLSTGSTFGDFIANMNATLLHYVPGFAYVEAAVVKGMDVMADFVTSKIPVVSSMFDYEEKHKGQSIGEIAKAICSDAEARYEVHTKETEANKALAAGKSGERVDDTVYATQSGTEPALA